MAINKEEGIDLLKILDMPTVEKLDIKQILSNAAPITDGLSIRLSPKGYSKAQNVYLPSIHNCTNKEMIRNFVAQYSKKYNVFAHKTVKPEIIGSASRLDNESIVIEMFQDFEHRKREEISNRMTIPILGDIIMVNHMTMLDENPEDYKMFSQVIMGLRRMPFNNYYLEFVIENGKVIFTDLTIPDEKYSREIVSYLKQRKKEEVER